MAKGKGYSPKHAADRCHECHRLITFGTHDGQLVAFEPGSLVLHAHQPPGASPEANRERIARERTK